MSKRWDSFLLGPVIDAPVLSAFRTVGVVQCERSLDGEAGAPAAPPLEQHETGGAPGPRADETQALRFDGAGAQGDAQLAQALGPVDEEERAARGQQPGGGTDELVKRAGGLAARCGPGRIRRKRNRRRRRSPSSAGNSRSPRRR